MLTISQSTNSVHRPFYLISLSSVLRIIFQFVFFFLFGAIIVTCGQICVSCCTLSASFFHFFFKDFCFFKSFPH